MVSNSKDDHPSKATPITSTVPNTHPPTLITTVRQAKLHLLSSPPVGGEKSKQWMAHKGVQSDEMHLWIPLINPWRTCTVRVTVLGLCVCLSVCVSVTQHLTFHVFICATNDTNLLGGGWKSKILSNFLWKCFIAKLEHFPFVQHMATW